MKVERGSVVEGPAGLAVEVLISGEVPTRWQTATLGSWFLYCPGQSVGWDYYLLSVIHLRPIDGQPAQIRIPHATHEVILAPLDPEAIPSPLDPFSWVMLAPVNVCEQVQLPSDEDAVKLLAACAHAVAAGVLPAEPLRGEPEPWRTSLIRSSAHFRGEEHA